MESDNVAAPEPAKDDPTSERVEVVDQIVNVRIGIRQVGLGVCVICGEDEDVVEVYAAVYYPGRDTLGRKCMIESTWSQHFCSYCINSFFTNDPKEVGKSYQ